MLGVSAEAGSIQAVPVDFYAGAIATVAVILFAKFTTHTRYDRRWRFAHRICAGAAWVGLVLSLWALGWTPQGVEVGLRHVVVVAVMLAGTILAVDVAWPHPRGTDPGVEEERPANTESREPGPASAANGRSAGHAEGTAGDLI